MKNLKGLSKRRENTRSGRGLVTSALSSLGKVLNKVPAGPIVNTIIDALPVELHIPGYQYCGAGTKLEKRLARGDPGINKLDQACKEHDIAYSKHSDTSNRSVADKILAQKAWGRVKSSDASVGERTAALAVTAAMKAKTALGSGYKKNKKRSNRNRKSHTKRGGNITRRKRNPKRKLKKNLWEGNWKVLKSGKGLYLRPYRNV